MMTDKEIIKNIEDGEIIITPFYGKNLGSNSYDITIGNRIRSLKFNCGNIDLAKQDQYNYLDTNLPYAISPGETIVFSSKETFGCKSKTLGIIAARSNLSRTGLIFQSSSLLDTGFIGVLSGAIHNTTQSSIIIPENLRVMQIMFVYNAGSLIKKYNDRNWSKNVNQFNIEDIVYKPDKEFRKNEKPEA